MLLCALLREPLPDHLQLLERFFLLLEILGEELRDFGLAHRFGHRHETLVGRDLVMLGARTGTRQERVQHFLRRRFLGDEIVMLFLDPVDSGALFRARFLTELLERLLHVLDVLPRLVKVVLEADGELFVGGLILLLG